MQKVKSSKTQLCFQPMGGRTTFGPFVLDRERKKLTRHGQSVPLNHRGYILLETLLDAGGEPVMRDVLMERAWPGIAIEEGNLTVQIAALRRQLGEGSDALIMTVPRIGYRLVAAPPNVRGTEAVTGGPPLVAVLPFANHGRVSEDGYFADGVVDDIITALSRFKTFAVVSRAPPLPFAKEAQTSSRRPLNLASATRLRAASVDLALDSALRRSFSTPRAVSRSGPTDMTVRSPTCSRSRIG
jgi:DNA-binding winged helix-turn-helix (wHTH) protein